MKKMILSLAILGALLSQSAVASETVESDQTGSLKGPAVGALAGGLLAGPPGLMVGLIGGALIGQIKVQEAQIHQTQGDLAVTRAQVETLTRQQANQHARLLQQIEANGRRVSAVSEGFSFCLRFRSESAAIESTAKPHLMALVGMLKVFPELAIEVRASADRRGSDAFNRQLAQLRAEAVAELLRKAGVQPERIRIHVIGEAEAVYAEDDPEGLGFDRYVVLSFQPGETS